MAKQQAKKVISRFSGKGFQISPTGKISHTSSQMYTDKQAFLESENDTTAMDMLDYFSIGIMKCLRNKRIKPGSLRISFQILEK